MIYKIATVLLVCSYAALAQGTFQNLDFESATIPAGTPTPSSIPISEGLPGWSAFFIAGSTTVPANQVVYDGISLGGAVISILDSKGLGFSPLQGTYSAFLFGGGAPLNPLNLDSVGISQTAVVPPGTQSVEFYAYNYGPPFVVTLGGQMITVTILQTFTHYALYGGNIPSGMAGQNETLSFVEPPALGVQPSMCELDNITFSQTAVTPEPSPLALTGLSGAAFALYRLARKLRLP
jgi:hypothetical protein